jgi:hypothetical protein
MIKRLLNFNKLHSIQMYPNQNGFIIQITGAPSGRWRSHKRALPVSGDTCLEYFLTLRLLVVIATHQPAAIFFQ